MLHNPAGNMTLNDGSIDEEWNHTGSLRSRMATGFRGIFFSSMEGGVYHPDCGITTITKRHEPTELCVRYGSPRFPLTRPPPSIVMEATNNMEINIIKNPVYQYHCSTKPAQPPRQDFTYFVFTLKTGGKGATGRREDTRKHHITRCHSARRAKTVKIDNLPF